jgi:hypothetical protein
MQHISNIFTKEVLAASGPAPESVNNPVLGTLGSMDSISFLSALLSTVVAIIIFAGGVTFFIMLLIGGLNWITAGEDKAKLEGARNRIIHALTGFIIILATWAIITAIEHIFSIKILTINITNLIIK